ncbi:ArsA family ATPase [Streptomyces scopuliridis]|uniref:ArsA family ATPase n=1 Tax=Streptomyces scopuliridis TaxID=452529 RepID=A0ACD4ZR81_9ACTN|nr:ArsA-related P-loop ATPase [Streptomyces scopuliridis]WSC00542.1 ArsA family ATPase [Streptomyces scopuliridis]WSC05847.1 ArsA family ATPase [Streptomyces scopuliridis]
MRTVLVTGPGGAGRTTIAAATALAAARRGRRVLLLSADPLGDVLGTPAGSPEDPAPVRDGLWAARVDSGAHFRTETLAFQERAATALELLGARKLAGEELTELPGSEQSALLHALRRAASGDWDVLVVDLPPLRDALALLALPGHLRRYLRRLLPQERQAARALRPMMAQLAGIPMPAQWLYETAARWDAELAAVQSLIEDPATTLRLVAEPGPAAAEALRAARAGIALYGLRVDALVPNRILPGDAADPWLATLVAQQRKCLDEWHEGWPPGMPVHAVGHLGRDPRGLDDLALLDSAPEGAAGPPVEDPWPVEDRLAEENLLVWCLPLPGAVKSELALVRRDDELLLTVGPFRRIVPLPSALRRCSVTGAALTDGVLRVRFTPDPDLWPRGH